MQVLEQAHRLELSVLSDEALRALDHVIDHNAAEITCPACGTTFASGPESCPDCELFIGTP